MFYRSYKFTKTIEFFIESTPSVSTEGVFFFGYPLHHSICSISAKNILSELNNIKGYFLFVGIDSGKLIIANDILGGFRLYKFETDDRIIYTDNYNIFVDSCAHVKLNKHEYHYWVDHGYTTGGQTLFSGLMKLPPASVIKYGLAGEDVGSYFLDIKSSPSVKKHIELVLDDLKDSVELIKANRKKVVLLFSGGKDSLLLASILGSSGVDYEAVFLKVNPPYKESLADYHKAVNGAKQLGINLRVIDFDVSDEVGFNKFIKEKMLFDRHFSSVHYFGVEAIAREFGTDIIMVNGQSADSIFSFGASEKTAGYFCRRLLIDFNNAIFRLCLSPLFSRRLKKSFVWGPFDSLLDFYDNVDYVVLPRSRDQSYRDYLNGIISGIRSMFNNQMSLKMYLKMHSFLQGSDNQIVINTARHHGIDSVFMPYATSSIVYGTVKCKAKFVELIDPKYVVGRLLSSVYGLKHRPVSIGECESMGIEGAMDYVPIIEAQFTEILKQYVNEEDFS